MNSQLKAARVVQASLPKKTNRAGTSSNTINSPWIRWYDYFVSNAHRQRRYTFTHWQGCPHTSALSRTLEVLRLGETGEGRIITQVARSQDHPILADPYYRKCLELFIAEEGQHVRILRGLIRALKPSQRLKANWTAKLFSMGRRLFGIRFKLLLMLVAEVAASILYCHLAGRVKRHEFYYALQSIQQDEQMHLAFHADFFSQQMQLSASRGPRLLFLFLFRSLSAAAWWSLRVDHGRTFNVLGVSLPEMKRDFRAVRRWVEHQVITSKVIR